MIGFYIPDFKFIIPESLLVISALFILIRGVFQKNSTLGFYRRYIHYSILALMAALLILIFQHNPGEKWITFEGQVFQDDFIFFAKILILTGSGAVLAISLPSIEKDHVAYFEYSPLILLATVGMLLIVEANDFLTLFIGLEMQGLSLYILAALSRDQIKASEAALKYFVLGGLATCLYLYGASLIYGFSGSTNFEIITSVVRNAGIDGFPLGLLVALIFIMAAFCFKISAVPFHMWTPDVYQGCPTTITAFISSTPKVAAMVIFLRIMIGPFLLVYGEWQSLIIFISFASMILGAFAALTQTNLKRLLAYSAIGQMGYVLIGVAAGNDEGAQAVCVYLTLYLIMIVGTFGCLLCLRGKGSEGVESIEDLSGISVLHPKISFALAVFMFSLAGIPPLAGFFAKLYIFKAAIAAGFFGLAIVAVLTSVVATYYYLKIVKVMYFDGVPLSPGASYGHVLLMSPEVKIILNICVVIISSFFLFPSPLLNIAQRAALALPI